jgi:hypothetical protein
VAHPLRRPLAAATARGLPVVVPTRAAGSDYRSATLCLRVNRSTPALNCAGWLCNMLWGEHTVLEREPHAEVGGYAQGADDLSRPELPGL